MGDLIRAFRTNHCGPRTSSPPASVTVPWKRDRAPIKITTNNYEFTEGLKGNLGEFGRLLQDMELGNGVPL